MTIINSTTFSLYTYKRDFGNLVYTLDSLENKINPLVSSTRTYARVRVYACGYSIMIDSIIVITPTRHTHVP